MEYEILNIILSSTAKSLFESKNFSKKIEPPNPAKIIFSPENGNFVKPQQFEKNSSLGLVTKSISVTNDHNTNKISFSAKENADKFLLVKSLEIQERSASSEFPAPDAFHQILSRINSSFQENKANSANINSSITKIAINNNQNVKEKSSTNSSTSTLNSSINEYINEYKKGVNEKKDLKKITLEQWMKVEARKILLESLNIIGILETDIAKIDFSRWSLEELTTEKKKIKNELKSYDSLFFQHFNKTPGRNEKEPMRPLYIYYKRVKQALSKGPPSSLQQKPGNNNSNMVLNSAANPKLEDQKNKQMLTSAQAQQLLKKLDELKNIRVELREKLHKYQNDFVQLHARKIKYHKDLAPIENEYKMYKQVKVEIQELETKLGIATKQNV